MIHISDLSWTRKYGHPSEAMQRGQEVKCVVLEVDEDKRRISLGIKQMTEDPWVRAIPEKYIPGHIIKGTVTKLTNFGAFVELEPDLEGLLHISELADHKIDKPQDVIKVGQELEVKILKVESDARKIGLSLRRAQWAAEEQGTDSDQRHTPIGVETVLSDAQSSEITNPQEKTDESQDSDKQATETVVSETESPKSADEPNAGN